MCRRVYWNLQLARFANQRAMAVVQRLWPRKPYASGARQTCSAMGSKIGIADDAQIRGTCAKDRFD